MPRGPDITTEFIYCSTSHQETRRVGAELGKRLQAGNVVCLFGDLGSGKTCFVQGIAEGLEIPDRWITSPTFTLVNEYQGRLPFYHIDLYKAGKIRDLRSLGLEEIFYGQGVIAVEWAEQLGDQLPSERIDVRLTWKSSTERVITCMAYGKEPALVIEGLKDGFR